MLILSHLRLPAAVDRLEPMLDDDDPDGGRAALRRPGRPRRVDDRGDVAGGDGGDAGRAGFEELGDAVPDAL